MIITRGKEIANLNLPLKVNHNWNHFFLPNISLILWFYIVLSPCNYRYIKHIPIMYRHDYNGVLHIAHSVRMMTNFCWGNMLSTLTLTTTSIVWFPDVPSTTSRVTPDTFGPMLCGPPFRQEMGQMEPLNAGAPGIKSWEEKRSWDSNSSNAHPSS